MTRRLEELGQLVLVGFRAVAATPRLWWRELVRILAVFGYGSLAIALAVAAATGSIIVLETATYTVAFGARDILGGMAGISILREFGPLMVALVMSGWVGASNAAELGNLALGGQLTGLRGIGVDPYQVIIAPRLLGTLVAMVALALPVDLGAIVGGAGAARFALHIDPGVYFRSFETLVKPRDVLEGLVKIFAFGAAIGLISTRAGLQTRGGARAVGRAVAGSVVRSVFAVLVLDAVITATLGGRL